MTDDGLRVKQTVREKQTKKNKHRTKRKQKATKLKSKLGKKSLSYRYRKIEIVQSGEKKMHFSVPLQEEGPEAFRNKKCFFFSADWTISIGVVKLDFFLFPFFFFPFLSEIS